MTLQKLYASIGYCETTIEFPADTVVVQGLWQISEPMHMGGSREIHFLTYSQQPF